MNKIKVGIVGVSGYSGKELLVRLIKHPNVDVVYASANNNTGNLSDIWPDVEYELNVSKYDYKEASAADVLFLATPHTVSMQIAPDLLKNGKKVIDLSGDYRLNSADDYQKWYKAEHANPELLKKGVYGLSEVFSDQIKTAQLVANPGCYPTASLLSVAPIHDLDISHIYIDAKSGVSGAGINNAPDLLKSTKDSFKAYKALTHQHAPEIELAFSAISSNYTPIAFVPHLLPIMNGMFATVFVQLEQETTIEILQKKYVSYYANSPFVKVLEPGNSPEIKSVVGTNNAQLSITYDQSQKVLVVTTVIDNLVKGASGQAIQNFNIMHGFDQTMGLL